MTPRIPSFRKKEIAAGAAFGLLLLVLIGQGAGPGAMGRCATGTDELWQVNATITETITRTGSRHSSWSTPITPDQLIKASRVTIVKDNHLRWTSTASAFVSMVVPNEGVAPELVIAEAKPVSKRVAGSLTESWEENRIETVNGIVADYSSNTEEGKFHTVFSDVDVEAEFSEGYKGLSVSAYGQGESLVRKRRHEKGTWRTFEPSRTKRGANCSFGVSEEQSGWLSRRGDTIHVNKTESKTTRREDQDFGMVTTVVRRTITATLRPLSQEPPQADPGGPYEVERGGRVTLDGSNSKGNLVSYEWKFSAAPGYPSDVPIGSGPKEGQSIDILLLCPVKASLTVSDGRRTSTRDVVIKIKPRDWKTPFEHIAAEGALQPAVAPLIDPHLMAFGGGANVCSLDPDQDENHSFHPGAASGTWDGSGYNLVQVVDPGGPFENLWYVESYLLRISRQTLVNPYLLPGGRPPLTGLEPWYDYNSAKGAPVQAYLAAVREHEREHSNRKSTALESGDPAKTMEPLFGVDKDRLKNELDGHIRDAEFALCQASQDPLPSTWKGMLWFPKIDTGVWMRGEVEVGGPRQIETPPCKK